MFFWALVFLYFSQCIWVILCLHWVTISFIFSELFVTITQQWAICIYCSAEICRIYLNACARNLILLKINRSQFTVVQLERVWMHCHASSLQFIIVQLERLQFNVMQLHSLKQKIVKKFSASCFWYNKSESSFLYCIMSIICSNIMCWVTQTDFFSSFSSFSSQHVCLIHWYLQDCNQHCCLCSAHFNLNWNWNMSSDMFILYMLHIVCASCENLVLMTDWLRHV